MMGIVLVRGGGERDIGNIYPEVNIEGKMPF